MFIFLLQVRHMLGGHPELYLFAVYSALIWGLWLTKLLISQRYRPYLAEHQATTSVVIPVVDEPLDLFRDVLARIVEQHPTEIIVVINGARNVGLEEVCRDFAPFVQWVHTPIPGKRNAVKIGTELSKGEITVLVDSDTLWTPSTLSELVKPFGDDRVGGATTRQRILEPSRTSITRWADWLENSRSLYSMPAQSVLGQVGCLPGRTIAFRRSILMRVMDKFMGQKFMGVFLEISDDRTLTNLTLTEGYRTVYQHTSLVYTDAPLQMKKLAKQQLRWARGSQYNTLRMLPWMLGHAPVLALFMSMDIILPFLLAGVIGGWVYRAATSQGENLYEGILHDYGLQTGLIWVVALVVISSVLSMAIRQLRHLAEKPSDFWRLPFFILFSTLFLMPIRLLGFFRMGHVAGWGTRAGAYTGGGDPDEDLIDELAATAPSGGRAHPFAPEPDSGTRSTPSGRRAASTDTGSADLHELFGDLSRSSVVVAERPRRETEELLEPESTSTPTAPTRRRLNPKAAWPYVIGLVILAGEAILIV
ncbi:MAG: glycosyltransferase [Leifsonia sp.]